MPVEDEQNVSKLLEAQNNRSMGSRYTMSPVTTASAHLEGDYKILATPFFTVSCPTPYNCLKY